MKHDESKLPKWARAELETLRHKISSLRKIIESEWGDEKSQGSSPHVEIGYGSVSDHPLRRVALDTRFGFYLPSQYPGRRYIDIRWDEGSGYLEMHASSPVSVHPRASNAIRVALEG